jgi:hypothetical protein
MGMVVPTIGMTRAGTGFTELLVTCNKLAQKQHTVATVNLEGKRNNLVVFPVGFLVYGHAQECSIVLMHYIIVITTPNPNTTLTCAHTCY